MVAFRGISGSLYQCFSRRKHFDSLSQCLFLRGLASKIFVKHLAFSITEEKLAEAFSQYGEVIKADVVMNKAKTRCKGFGFVTFAEEEEAHKACMDMNGKTLLGRVIYVDMEPGKRTSRDRTSPKQASDD
ncbi:hypothetical protein L6164_031789 [Bauhinia variegata]|uniref:Uncharacterized protein n=1 Tax=Bauhinia variegata TaxID=167791 RepID=A0ACB9KLR0_BAUVA|nr:hypothetical protein L6164_031789 [Bauhinia variegata]